VDLAVSAFGRLDVMVNNAGIVGAVGPIAATRAEAWDATIAVLLRGVFLGMKHAARVMVPQRSGVILSIASTAGVVGGLGPHAYTAAKHGVVGLTKSVASELAPHGIRVNAVAPGNTVTAMTAAVIAGDPAATARAETAIAQGSALGIAGMPRDIALALLYLASDDARYVTAHTLVADAGQTAALGRTVFHDAPSELIREAGKRER
jgi:NAD(P)-dependent dehydrogenase (short-subunit alcohol dehydrogenase family)